MISNKKQIQRLERNEIRGKLLYGWAVRQLADWTVAKAAEATGLPSAWIEMYLRSSAAFGWFDAVGRVETDSRWVVNTYIAYSQEQFRCVNLFQCLAKYGHDEDFEARLPDRSTKYPPGSPEKIEVMRMRIERGEALDHPDDNRRIERVSV